MNNPGTIKATIFIPTWFGEDYLAQALDAIFKQQVDFEYEVLIFDTSSTDKTVEIIESFQQQHQNLRFKSITKPEFQHGKTRNEAAHEAKGEFIVYLTQDATPAHDRWLYELLKPFEISERIMGVLGKQIPRPHCIPMLKSEINGTFRGLGPDYSTTLSYKDNFVVGQGIFDAVRFYSDVNSAARVNFLKNTIPYREVSYAEDQLFGEDIINAGYIKAYAPRAAVLHSNDLTLRQYSKRMFDETYGLRKTRTNVPVPSLRTIGKIMARGIVRDAWNIMHDPSYSFLRKAYWLLVNPFFYVEKWRGVRKATKMPLENSNDMSKYSLEESRKKKRRQ